MEHKTDIKNVYSVIFWANPKSGFDLMRKNAILSMLRDVTNEFSENDPHIEDKIQSFEAENDGMVIYDEVIESDTLITDPETEVMPLIRKKYPEAKYVIMIPMIFNNK